MATTHIKVSQNKDHLTFYHNQYQGYSFDLLVASWLNLLHGDLYYECKAVSTAIT